MPGIHKELRIIKGLNTLPGQSTTLEPGLEVVLDLLSGSGEGFAVENDIQGWNPSLPAPKAGVWNDVPFVDGRQPIANANQNVIETLNLTLSAPTYVRLAQWMSKLAELAKDCLRFWQDEGIQLSPVYLHWWANGAPGPQYALIVSLDYDESIPTIYDDGAAVRDVTLTIERESYWRWVPPGGSAKLWTQYQASRQPGKDYTVNNISSLSLVTDSVDRYEAYNPQTTTTLTQIGGVSVTIPADDLPGDVPPLLTVRVTPVRAGGDTDDWNLMAATISRRLTFTGSTGAYRFFGNLPGLAATRLTGTVVATDTGGRIGYDVNTAAFVGTASRLEITPTASVTSHIRWTQNISFNVLRGRFAVFLRCRQNGGSSGDIEINLRYGNATTQDGETTEQVTPTVVAGTGNTSRFPMVYMGTIKLPPDFDSLSDRTGTGLIDGFGCFIELQVVRSTGTALLYVADLLLMPIDEGFVTLEPGTNVSSKGDSFILDNTGYLAHGKPGLFGRMDNGNPNIGEVAGADLVVQPGVDNTLFFALYNQSFQHAIGDPIHITVDIIPRSRGIRDT